MTISKTALDEAEHLEAARQRMNDPGARSEHARRAAAISKRMFELGINRAGLALQAEKTHIGKVVWLRRVSAILAEATKGYVPCKAGCAHCCHMATLVTIEEAEAIAAATGRKMTMPPPEVLNRSDDEIKLDRAEYEGVPCTFLKDGQCSIYQHRPHACRVHYSLDHDSLLCRIVPGHDEIRTPMVNPAQFNLLHMMTYDDPRTVRFADIRAFFPPGPTT